MCQDSVCFFQVATCIGVIFVISYSTPIFLSVVIPIIIFYYYVQVSAIVYINDTTYYKPNSPSSFPL